MKRGALFLFCAAALGCRGSGPGGEASRADAFAIESVKASGRKMVAVVSGLRPMEEVCALWRDSFDRVIGSTVTMPSSPRAKLVVLADEPPLAHGLLTLRQGPRAACRRFFLPPGEAPGYTAVACRGAHRREPEFWSELRRKGFNAVLARGGKVTSLPALHGFAWGLEFSFGPEDPFVFGEDEAAALLKRYAEERTPASLVRPRCPSVEGNMERALRLGGVQRYLAGRYGAGFFSLPVGAVFSPPGSPLDFCFGEKCLGSMRSWLKGRYRSLEELNLQWNTQYSSWETVEPLTCDETKSVNYPAYARGLKKGGDFALEPSELGAPGGENFSSWLDHIEFCEHVLARTCARFKETGFASDETARVNWPLMAKSADWIATPPDELAKRLLLSSGTRTRRLGLIPRDGGAAAIWTSALNKECGCLALGEPTLLDERTASALCSLTSGVGLLLRSAQWRPDPVAIYHSPESLRVLWMLDSMTKGSGWVEAPPGGPGEAVERAWFELFSDCGFAVEILDARAVRAGELPSRNYRAIVLPATCAVSEEEAQALEEFVRRGGLLVADRDAGTFDARGKRGRAGRLDALFGVERRSLGGERGEGEITVERGAGQGFVDGVSTEGMVAAEPGLRAKGASRYGSSWETACFLMKPEGAGRAVYLNLNVEDYLRPRGAGFRRLATNLMELADLRPRVVVTRDGELVSSMRLHLYCLGETQILAVTASGERTEGWVRLRFRRRWHVYDVFRGEYCSFGKVCDVKMDAARPLILALFPYDIENMEFRVRRRGERFTYRAWVEPTSGPPSTHVFRVEVVSPSGRKLGYYTRVVMASRGAFAGEFSPAENEPPGTYVLVVTDVLTGQTARARLLKTGSSFANWLRPTDPMDRVRIVPGRPEPDGQDGLRMRVELRELEKGALRRANLRVATRGGWGPAVFPVPEPGTIEIKLKRSGGIAPGALKFMVDFTDGWKQETRLYPVKMLACPRIEGPKLDGEAEEGAITVVDMASPEGGKVRAGWQGRLGWTDEGLYLCVLVEGEAEVREFERDGPVWESDSFEVFVDCGQVYRFAVGASGAMYDARDGDSSWNAPWRALARNLGEKWVVEMMIPFSSLGVPPRPGGSWGLNFVRHSPSAGTPTTMWAPTGPNLYARERFGTVVFK